MEIRHALYFVPDENSPLGLLGSSVLGRSLARGVPVERPVLKGIPKDELIRNTLKASAYGFHAPLVAPFRSLMGEGELTAFLEGLLSGRKKITLPRLSIETPRGAFTALVPEFMPEELSELEKLLVTSLAPVMDRNAPRKDRGPLTKRQGDYYERFGYPFVLEEYRFHMTLGDTADEKFALGLRELFDPAALAPSKMAELCLGRQEGGGPFEVAGRVGLAG